MIDSSIWQAASNCTKEARLRLLHFKILYGIYPTNKMLHKMGIVNSINCKFCPHTLDTLEHFFFECNRISQLWKHVEDKILIKTVKRCIITVGEALIGIGKDKYDKDTTRLANHIILIAKMCISIYRYGTPIDINILFERELLIRRVE